VARRALEERRSERTSVLHLDGTREGMGVQCSALLEIIYLSLSLYK
jgi:hypothetical protein